MHHLVFLLFSANAEPTRPPLRTISDDAMRMAKRAAVVLLVSITINYNAIFFKKYESK